MLLTLSVFLCVPLCISAVTIHICMVHVLVSQDDHHRWGNSNSYCAVKVRIFRMKSLTTIANFAYYLCSRKLSIHMLWKSFFNVKEKPAKIRPSYYWIHDSWCKSQNKAISCLPEFSPNIGSTRYKTEVSEPPASGGLYSVVPILPWNYQRGKFIVLDKWSGLCLSLIHFHMS